MGKIKEWWNKLKLFLTGHKDYILAFCFMYIVCDILWIMFPLWAASLLGGILWLIKAGLCQKFKNLKCIISGEMGMVIWCMMSLLYMIFN